MIASSAIRGTVATNSVIGLWANPANSYQKAPATSATLAEASLKCRRAKKYMEAGMATDEAQNASLTAPMYQNG